MSAADHEQQIGRVEDAGEPTRARHRHGPDIASQLGHEPFDLLVIGAGINGAGIARDAALRGLRVALLDKGDIASGTTSWSSRLVHGGLRYLEYGEVGLVRESLHERETLLHIAAHLVHPLPLMIPIYDRDRRGKRLVRLGMIGYDVLSTGKSLDRHRMLSAGEALARAPGLEAVGLTGAALYYDAQVEYAERLAVENAIDAAGHGAVLLTYCRVDRLEQEGKAITGATFTDLLDGGQHRIQARLTVNVTGPWVDATLGHPAELEQIPPQPLPTAAERGSSPVGEGLRSPSDANEPLSSRLGDESRRQPARATGRDGEGLGRGLFPARPDAEPERESFVAAGERFVRGFMGQWRATGPDAARLIGGTKGSHIIVDRFPGAPHDALYVEARSDGRPFFIIPWNHLFLIGTTDVRYEGDLERVVASDAEIDYLIAESNRVLPSAGLDRDKVRYTYSGIRPLPYQDDASEGAITRRHLVYDHAPATDNLISIVGGKLTTFRELGEQTVDLALTKLGRPKTPSRTAEMPLPGNRIDGRALGQEDVSALADQLGQQHPTVSQRTISHLVGTFGTRSGDILGMAASDPDLAAVIDPLSGAIAAEIIWTIDHEDAQQLDDILLRRTMLGYGPTNAVGIDERVAAIAGARLGWDADRQTAEVKAYRDFITRYRPKGLASHAQ